MTKKSSAESRTGKGSPPPERQFRPGQSGNPKGRPKGSQNRHTTIRKVLSQIVNADFGNKRKKISVSEASLQRLAQIALSGDRAAISNILALWKETEDTLAAERDSVYPFTEADREVIEAIYARMKACQGEAAS